MDSSTRRFGTCNRLRIGICLSLVIGLSGCPSAIPVSDKCEGLEEIGYSLPVSQTALDDIKALGFAKCAEYIIEKLLN